MKYPLQTFSLLLAVVLSLPKSITAQKTVTVSAAINSAKLIEDRLYLTTDKGIILLDQDFNMSSLAIEGLPAESNDLAIGPDSTVYVATDEGLFITRGGKIIKMYNRQKGLASNTITAVLAVDGGLWIGSDKGLAYLKDKTYKFYSKSSGLLDNEIRLLRLDSHGRLFVVTQKGLSKIENQEIASYEMRDITSLAIDAADRVFVGTPTQLLSLKEGKLQNLLGMKTLNVADLFYDHISDIWGFTLSLQTDKLNLFRIRFDGQNHGIENEVLSFTPLSSTESRLIRIDQTGNKFIVMNDRVIVFPRNPDQRYFASHLEENANEYYLLGRYADATRQFQKLLTNFSQELVHPQSVLRLAICLQKLNRQTESAAQFLKLRDDAYFQGTSDPAEKTRIKAEAIFRLAEMKRNQGSDDAATLYEHVAATYPQTVFSQRAVFALGQFYKLSAPLRAVGYFERYVESYQSGELIWQAKLELAKLYEDTQPDKFAAIIQNIFETCHDLDVMYAFRERHKSYLIAQFRTEFEKRERRTAFTTLFSDTVEISDIARDGDILWLATNGAGVRYIDLNDQKWQAQSYTQTDGLASNYVNHIFIDKLGKKWFSCGNVSSDGKEQGGLTVFDGQKWTTFDRRKGLVPADIRACFVSDNQIHVATSAGLYTSKNTAFPYWYQNRMTQDLAIRSVFEDALGVVWLSTSGQILSLQKTDLKQVLFTDSTGKTLEPQQLIELSLDELGNKTATTELGVFRFEKGVFLPHVEIDQAKYGTPRSSLVDPGGTQWIVTEQGLLKQSDEIPIYFNQGELDFPGPRGMIIHNDRRLLWNSRSVGEHYTTILDTLKLIEGLETELSRWESAADFGRVRLLCRRYARWPGFGDYLGYRIGLSYEEEDKLIDAFGYFRDYIRSRTQSDYVSEFTFFSLTKAFAALHDFERADYISRSMLYIFSSSNNNLDSLTDESIYSFTLDMSREKNTKIVGLFTTWLDRAADEFRQNKIRASLKTIRNMNQIFRNNESKRITDSLFAMGNKCEIADNTTAALQYYTLFIKSPASGLDERLIGVLQKNAALYRILEQYDDAASMYDQILATGLIRKLAPEMNRLSIQSKQFAGLGIRSGAGLSELNTVHTMLFEGNYLWQGTSKGVIRWDVSKGSYKKFTTKNGLFTDNVSSITIDKDNGKWFAGNNLTSEGKYEGGITHFDGESFTTFSKNPVMIHTGDQKVESTQLPSLPGSQIRVVRKDRLGRVWAGTENGVLLYDTTRWTLIDLKKEFDFSYVSDLKFDHNNTLWIALAPLNDFYSNSGGTIRFEAGNSQVLREKDGLTSNFVKSISIDSSNNVWFLTDKGISILQQPDNKWSYITKADGLASSLIRDISFGSGGDIWIGSNRGLTKIESMQLTRGTIEKERTFKNFSEKQGLVSEDIRSVITDAAHGTWVGTKRGSFSVGNIGKAATGDDESVIAGNRKLFEVSFESEALFDKAQLYIEQGDYDKAREIYLDVLDRAGDGEWADDATLLLAKSYELEGNYEEAAKTYEEFFENYKESDLIADAYIGLGNLHERQKKFEKAEEAYLSAEKNARNQTTRSQAKILSEKVRVKKIRTGRSKAEELGQIISGKKLELSKATNENDKLRLRKEILLLEQQAVQAAQIGGFNLKLYTVKENDTFWDLSRKMLGDPLKWKDFFIANEGKVTDPDLIVVGQTIVVLTPKEGFQAKLDEFLYYEVSAGEDLETIAQKLYGDTEKWKVIFNANKEKLPESPKKSLSRMRIIIPIVD